MFRNSTPVQAGVEYISLNPGVIDELTRLFVCLIDNGDDLFFHPHPLNREEAEKKAAYKGKDFYFVQCIQGKVTGYGMLRGWEEGYIIPSLGIAIHPKARGQGLAKDFLFFLHRLAIRKGAKMIRLTVHRENRKAVLLYRKMGYLMQKKTADTLEGFLNLNTALLIEQDKER